MEKIVIQTASYITEAEKAAIDRANGVNEDCLNYFTERLARREPFVWEKHRQLPATQPLSGNYFKSITPNQQLVLTNAMSNCSATLQNLTLAALAIYFHKTSGLLHLTFGTTLHKRQTEAQKKLVGMFSGVVPVAIQLNDNGTLGELLNTIANERLAVRTYQNALMIDLAGKLNVGNQRSPLVDVVVNYAPYEYQPDFGNLQVASVEILRSEFQEFPLEICWRNYGPQQPLQLGIHYKYQYFSKEEITFFANRLFYLMEQFAGGIAQSVEHFSIVPKEEQQMLYNFGIQKQKAGALWQFEAQVKKTPQYIAAICGNDQLSYEALNQKANRLARYLITKGVQPAMLVPVCIDRCTDLLVCILAILKAGGAYVPIDPQYPHERLMFMLEDTSASLVLTNNHGKQALAGNGVAEVINIDMLTGVLETFNANDLSIAIAANDLAYVMYTSGSTGKPKGVMIEHGNIEALIHWAQHQYNAGSFDLVYFSTSICFDLSVFEMFYPLSIGKTIRIVENGLDIMNYLLIDRNTLVNTVPVVMETMLKESADLSHVNIINMCGEPVPVPVKDGLPTNRAQVINLYGPTEATVYSTVFRLTKNEPVLIGKPLSNWTIYLLDKNNRPVPLGETGEICIGGAGVARGYFNRPELTNEKFIPDPFVDKPNARLYKTGDLARWRCDGNLEYIGRADNQVKVNGYRIDLGEIESIILESKLVQQAAVKVFNNITTGKYLVAYVVPLPAASFQLSTLQLHLAKMLPQFMLPSQWVVLQKMPLTSNGKIDRKALPADVKVPPLPSDHIIPPTSELELTLCNIFAQVLHLEKIGINQNFFNLGGTSINAVQIAARVRQLGLAFSPRDILYHPTIQQLAGSFAPKPPNLAQNNATEGQADKTIPSYKYLIRAQKGKPGRTPLYIVCGGGGNFFTFLNFIEQLHPDQPVYIMEYPADAESIANMPGDMKTLANWYIKELLANDPNGRCVLSGHCLGGIIAFEMAKQLESMGKIVDKLLIFDAVLKNEEEAIAMMISKQGRPIGKRMSKLSAFHVKLDFQLFLLRKHPQTAIKYKIDAIKKRFTSKISGNQSNPSTNEIRLYDEMKNKLSAAYKKYELTPFHKQLFVFYAKDQYYFYDKNNNITYRRYEISTKIKDRWLAYGKDVQWFDIEGEHNTMFDAAFGGKVLAQKIQQLIDEATFEKESELKLTRMADKFERVPV